MEKLKSEWKWVNKHGIKANKKRYFMYLCYIDNADYAVL